MKRNPWRVVAAIILLPVFLPLLLLKILGDWADRFSDVIERRLPLGYVWPQEKITTLQLNRRGRR